MLCSGDYNARFLIMLRNLRCARLNIAIRPRERTMEKTTRNAIHTLKTHVAINVSNVETSILFYRKMPGLCSTITATTDKTCC